MPTTETAAPSRYERFREILRTAAGNSASDHGGLGPFWELPLERLVDALLYGVRLIAAEETKHSCCSHVPSPSAESRSSRSGLIQGLRGEPPFDGSRFPRLPWGGLAVSPSDVEMIAGWIDDGCPRSDTELAAFDLGPEKPLTIALVRVTEPIAEPQQFSVREGGASEYMFERGELKQRMNIDCMSETQLGKLRYAMRELYELNKWPEDARSRSEEHTSE